MKTVGNGWRSRPVVAHPHEMWVLMIVRLEEPVGGLSGSIKITSLEAAMALLFHFAADSHGTSEFNC